MNVWYRYEDYRSGDECSHRSNIRLLEFPVAKITEQGVWIKTGSFNVRTMSRNTRFVLKDARKRFACPTKEEAMESFIARKWRQLSILEAQAKHVREALRLAVDVPNNRPRILNNDC